MLCNTSPVQPMKPLFRPVGYEMWSGMIIDQMRVSKIEVEEWRRALKKVLMSIFSLLD